MKIPKKIKVAGHIFEVALPYIFQERDDIFGRVDFSVNKIMITNINNQGNTCADSHTEQVFLHELFHTLDRLYCSNRLGVECDKELLVDDLAQGLLQILTDNFEPLMPKKAGKTGAR